MKTALITGGTGAVGPSIVSALAGAWNARLLCRRRPAGSESADYVVADLGSSGAAAACRGADVVFNLAARLHVPNPDAGTEAEFERVNVEGARHLARAAREAGVRRFVHFSTIAVYGSSGPALVGESSSLDPDTPYAWSKEASERAVADELRASATEHVILRLGAVYGSNLKGNYRRLVTSLCRGRFVPVGAGRNHRTLIHQSDVGRAARLAGEHPAAAGEIFNVTDGDTHAVAGIVESICRALDRPAPRVHVPAGLVRLALRGAEMPFRAAGRKAPVGPWLLDKYLEDVRVSGLKIRETLGFAPAMTLDGGWRETVQGLRMKGELPSRCRSFL